jgi:aldehyde:ferredoxin oxidoreductase
MGQRDPVIDDEGRESELDYEPVGLLGPNLDLYNLPEVASLNYLCDDYGLDTISAGAVLGFYADAIEHGDPGKLLAQCGLDATGIERAVLERFGSPLALVRPAVNG